MYFCVFNKNFLIAQNENILGDELLEISINVPDKRYSV